jgi:F-type H+-transporting ATPase subunit epsilon
MRDFELGVLTPTGEGFSGRVQELYLRTTSGEIGILAGHTDYLAGVVPCAAFLTDSEGNGRNAFCGGGFLSILDGKATLTVDEFVFSEMLDEEAVKKGRDAKSAELAACDSKKEPERAQLLKDALARAEAKCRAIDNEK